MIDRISWELGPAPYADVRALAEALGVSEVLAQILVRRGFTDPAAARAFLHPDMLVHNPYAMAGMGDARRRIDAALKRGEPIAVYGDYDVDGVSATYLLVRVLRELGADVRWRLPNRFSDGYGVSAAAVDELAADGVKLLVTVDCGIQAAAEVARAQALGMDVIVTDHHEAEGDLPSCVVLAPKIAGYPFPHLAGVGVAFKLAHALLEEPSEPLVEIPLALRALTDVLALGTIADLVPLVGENRVFAAVGLGRLKSSPSPGLAALMEVAGVKGSSLSAGSVGFRLAPRLNAAGRLEDASLALELLGSESRQAALPMALRLDELNRERQGIEGAMFGEACAMVPEPTPPALVLSSPSWHEGVVGIVASRVAERFNRPTVLLSEGDEVAKGSGRSIAGFDLLAAVERSSGLLLAFGGHRAACGLRLLRRHIGAFREAFTEVVAAELGSEPARVRQIDALVGGQELTLALADELELMAPHGFGNRNVQLLVRDAELVDPRLTRGGRHMQYRVRCQGASCQAIHFNFSDTAALSGPDRHDVVLALTKNEYNGSVSAQVEVKDLVPAAAQPGNFCPTGCTADCRLCLAGSDLWRVVLEESDPARAAGSAPLLEDGAPDLAKRFVDRRGRAPAPAVGALLAGGERVLVIVAELARRRPVFDSPVLPVGGEEGGMYLHSSCLSRMDQASEARLVVVGQDLLAGAGAARLTEAIGSFEHVLFADPPLTRALLEAAAATCPQAWLHFAWGRAELDFAQEMRQAEYDLEGGARRLWRVLSAGAGEFSDELASALLAGGAALPSLPALAAALRVLREAGLVVVDEAAYELERPAVKVDITQTENYRAWHRLFHNHDFLRTCLAQRL